MKKILLIIMTLLHMNAFASSDIFRVNGCGITRNAFTIELTKAFAKKFNVETSINKKGSGTKALKALSNNQADIATCCRLPLRNSIDNEKNIWSIQVAWSALAFIVHESNKITNISTENLKKVLLGKIKNWKTLGGDDKPINLYLRNGKQTGIGFSSRIILFSNNKQNFSANATRVANSTITRKSVKNDPYALAIDDVTSVKNIPNIKILSIDGVIPSKETIMSEMYKFATPYYLYSNGRPKGLTRLYIKFLLSKEGQELISKLGNVNLSEGKSAKNLKFLLIELNP